MKRRLFGTLLALVLLTGFTVSAQDTLQVTDARSAAEMFTTQVYYYTLSPDGTMIAAWGSHQFCILTVSDGEEHCFSPGDFQGSFDNIPFLNPFVWSPDSTTLLFTEEIYDYAEEPDIWALNVETGTVTDLTDDHITGNMRRVERTFEIDYLPAYAPNGDIYFFRATPSPTDRYDYQLTLQRLPAGADTPETVADVSTGLTVDWSTIYFRPAVSPDGSQLVFPVEGPTIYSTETGLWLVDLNSGETRQLTDPSVAHTGMPEDLSDTWTSPVNPVWTADGSGIVFKLTTGRALPVISNFVYLNVASGEVSPVVDLSDLTIVPSSPLQSNESPDYIRMPRQGAVSADGRSFVYLRYVNSPLHAQLAVVPLPPDGSEPQIIGDVDFDFGYGTVPNPLMGGNRALLDGWLYTLGE